MHPDEEATIHAFISPHKRARWSSFLTSRRRRSQILDRLNHCRDLDERYVSELPPNANIVAILKARGAPDSCYVISDTGTLDGRELPLIEAIEETELGGWGTIISCLPGQLAYYYDECGARRLLLERRDPA